MDQIELQNYLYKHIPISKELGASVESIDSNEIILKALLKNNINHKSTAFGGSLHAIATLSCWSLLYVKLLKENIKSEIVIVDSSIKYFRPITQDFKSSATLAESDQSHWDKFVHLLGRKGKAKIKAKATFIENNHLAVEYSGTFAALLVNSRQQ